MLDWEIWWQNTGTIRFCELEPSCCLLILICFCLFHSFWLSLNCTIYFSSLTKVLWTFALATLITRAIFFCGIVWTADTFVSPFAVLGFTVALRSCLTVSFSAIKNGGLYLSGCIWVVSRSFFHLNRRYYLFLVCFSHVRYRSSRTLCLVPFNTIIFNHNCSRNYWLVVALNVLSFKCTYIWLLLFFILFFFIITVSFISL